MNLYICEKPSQAKDIQKHIGASVNDNGFYRSSNGQICITWCVGHLLELAEPHAYDEKFKKWSIDDLPILPENEKWIYNVAPKTSKQFKVIQQLVKKANVIIIATDPDREGEAIAWSLLERFCWKGETKRLWFSALDDTSIKKALANLKLASETYNLYLAAQARAKADWLVGLNSTRLFTLLGRNSGFDGVLSVGRVQTPVLKLIVDRDREIKNFIPRPYFSIKIHLSKMLQTFNATWVPEENIDDAGRCINESFARQIAQRLQQGEAKVINVNTERVKTSPPLAFSLSNLQKACSKKYGMSMSQVLNIAQSLYETHKITTYPRTDCEYLPSSMFDDAETIVSVIMKNDPEMAKFMPLVNLARKSHLWNDKKVTAHHGIIPTSKIIELTQLSIDEMKVYDLIRRNYLANFMLHNEVDKTVVNLISAEQKFQAKGTVSVERGWKVLFVNDDIENIENVNDELPVLSSGDICVISKVDIRSLQTKPPAHFDDGSLLDAMKQIAKYVENPQLKKMLKDTSGIGTEATRAGIVETLEKRNYIERKKKAILATNIAYALIDILPSVLKDPGMTALWEQELENIATGQQQQNEFMRKQYIFIKKLIQTYNGTELPKNTTFKKVSKTKSYDCPECKSGVLIKREGKSQKGKYIWFGCSRYKDGCKFTCFGDNKGNPIFREERNMRKLN